MKVLFVFNHPAPYKVRLFNELAKTIDLFVIFERGNASDRKDEFYNCKDYNFNHLILNKGAFSKENCYSSEVKKYIKKHHKEFDLIIMNGYSTIAERKAIFNMKRHHIEFVLYINGGVIRKENTFKRWFKKRIILSARKYISPCIEASRYLFHYGVNEKDVYHYPYSTVYTNEVLSSPLNEDEKASIRNQFNLPNSPLFITASQFIDRKNNIQLIDCFKRRSENLLLIGDGPLKHEYEEKIKKENIKNVYLKDFITKSELFKLLKGGDCFITLSKEDIFGHTTNEALANGIPVISSNKVISSLHLIKDGHNGFIVDLEDEDSIHKAIDNINICKSEECLKVAKENTIERSAIRHIEIFKELLRK